MAVSQSGWFEADENPLLSDSPMVWDQLVQAVGPASLLVVIDARLGSALKRVLTAEDILQEALLHAWRDRAQCEWRGVKSFRSWLLTIIDHRIRDAAERERAAKRGGGESAVPFSSLQRSGALGSTEPHFPGPIASTTPSRIAVHKEQAEAMQVALRSLPDELRDVVGLRLFEQITVEEIAERLGIGVSAVRHRFRKGAAIYRRKLMSELASRSQAIAEKSMRAADEDSSPDK